MLTKIKAKIIKKPNLEVIILTDEALPLSEINHIKMKEPSFVLVSDENKYEFEGSLTGLETVFLWSSSQSGKESLSDIKRLDWTG